jgi:type I restriction enzyme M protein
MPPKRDSRLGPLLRVFDGMRGYVDTSSFDVVAMALVFMRASRQDLWARLREVDPGDWASQMRLFEEALEPVLDNAASTLHEWPTVPLIQTVQAVDSLVRTLGHEDAFRLILEEFGSRKERLFTPAAVAATLTGMLDLEAGSSIHDPFCRSGELLVAAGRAGHAGVRAYGEMPDGELAAIARMNVQLHEVEGEIGRRDVAQSAAGYIPRRKFARILSNPPFNDRGWTHQAHGVWHYGQPPKHNANFAWLQYAVERLEVGGRASIVMANNAAFSASRSERDIRAGMVEDGCLEALISLPPALFRGTGVPTMVWLLTPPDTKRSEILFVDASKAGQMVSRTLRELSQPEVNEIVRSVKTWRTGRPAEGHRETITSVTVPLSAVRAREYDLNPSNFLTRPYALPNPRETVPRVRQLLNSLEARQAAAREGDSQAAQAARDYFPAISAAEFPSSADWTEVRLADICDLIPGTPTEEDPEGTVPLLKPKNLLRGRLSGPTDMINAAEAQRLARYQVRSGDLLCTRTGTVGKVGLAGQEQEGWIFGTGLIRIRAKPDRSVDPEFLSFYFTSPAAADWVERNAHGTSIPNIGSKVLGSLPVVLPPPPIQRAIASTLGKLNDSITAHLRISEATAELLNALLTLLVSADPSA